jgi:hypothetical protein
MQTFVLCFLAAMFYVSLFLGSFVVAVLGFELGADTLSHSTSPFL